MTRFYDVTVTLHSGHQVNINQWEGYAPKKLAELMSHGDGVLTLNHESSTQDVVRVEQIAAIHAEPSDGFKTELRDGERVWFCLRCDQVIGSATGPRLDVAVLVGPFGHKCGDDRD